MALDSDLGLVLDEVELKELAARVRDGLAETGKDPRARSGTSWPCALHTFTARFAASASRGSPCSRGTSRTAPSCRSRSRSTPRAGLPRCTSTARSSVPTSTRAESGWARSPMRGSCSRSCGASRLPRSMRPRTPARVATRRCCGRSCCPCWPTSPRPVAASTGATRYSIAPTRIWSALSRLTPDLRRRGAARGAFARIAGRAGGGTACAHRGRGRARGALARGHWPLARAVRARSRTGSACSSSSGRWRRTSQSLRTRPVELADAVSALRLATAAPVAAGPVLFERLDWRPLAIRPVLPIAAAEPSGEPTRLDSFRARLASDLLARLGRAEEDPELAEALDRWELSLFADEPFRSEQLREALAALLGGPTGSGPRPCGRRFSWVRPGATAPTSSTACVLSPTASRPPPPRPSRAQGRRRDARPWRPDGARDRAGRCAARRPSATGRLLRGSRFLVGGLDEGDG